MISRLARLQPRAWSRGYSRTGMNPPHTTKPNSAGILGDLYKFWFQHVDTEERLTVPTGNDNKRWFLRDMTFDQQCLSRFSPILASLRDSRATKDSILDTFKPKSALDWLALTILLDQCPRNCYRDAESAIVFTFFDPLALAIAQEAIKNAIPAKSPEIRYRLALRFWFYLPLMHSEDLKVHDTAIDLYEEMTRDFRAVLDPDGTESSLTEKEMGYRETLRRDRSATEELLALHMRMEKEHRDQIARFGRYPHRNEALGRVSTTQEEEFLKEGRTFG